MEKEQLIALVKKSQSGNQAAIEELLRYAHTSVSYQCRKMLNNEQDAEDLTQEVLVAIYTKLDTLQEPAAFWKWANQITTSRCINALNRTHAEYQFAEDEEGHSILDNLEELDEQVIPDKAIDNAETARMIEEIVEGLPDAQRACTLMFYYDEMSVKEIAQTMQVSENTVKSRLNYARKAIKEKVLGYEKQGVKLYGLSPLPFLLYFLRLAAKNSADKDAAGVMVAEVMATEGAAVGAATASVAGAGSAAAAAGGSVATTAAATTTATGIFAGISAKIVAGILAAVVTVGSVAAIVIPNIHRGTTEPSTAPTETISVTESVGHETVPITEVPITEVPETEATTETPTEVTETESATEAPTEVPETETASEAPTEVPETEAATEPPTEESEAVEDQPAECNHDYKSETVNPTCTSVGYTKKTCAKCGDVVKADENAALGHDWDEGEIIENATCETDGSRTHTCQRSGCDQTKTEKIAALGHTYEEVDYNPASCGMDGWHYYHCTIEGCAGEYSETIPATGHNWGEWTVLTEPTTEYAGVEIRKCQNYQCDALQQRSIDKLPAD